MSAARTFPITSLASFAKRIESLLGATRKRTPDVKTAVNWYRGHSASSSYKLLPYLYRHKTIKSADDLLALEDKMMSAFRRQAMLHSFQETTADALGRAQLLFYMQHHGVPTRLLDWTSNPFIALYFALSGAKRGKDDKYTDAAAVWSLDPFAWNRHALAELKWGDFGPANVEDSRIKSYLPRAEDAPLTGRRYELPIALVGAANNARMMAQRGHFTIFSNDTRPMETIYDKGDFPKDCLVRLAIPADSIETLLNDLIAVGYTDSVAYPDLEGLAMEIKRLHGFSS